jgi:hypothetical protein
LSRPSGTAENATHDSTGRGIHRDSARRLRLAALTLSLKEAGPQEIGGKGLVGAVWQDDFIELELQPSPPQRARSLGLRNRSVHGGPTRDRHLVSDQNLARG